MINRNNILRGTTIEVRGSIWRMWPVFKGLKWKRWKKLRISIVKIWKQGRNIRLTNKIVIDIPILTRESEQNKHISSISSYFLKITKKYWKKCMYKSIKILDHWCPYNLISLTFLSDTESSSCFNLSISWMNSLKISAHSALFLLYFSFFLWYLSASWLYSSSQL